MFALLCLQLIFCVGVQGFCGENVKWAHNVNIVDVYGMWYGVAYAQHTPDMTNKPNEVGCVKIYITDATYDTQDDWRDWSVQRPNYTDPSWRSYRNNPWSDTPLSGSWLDIPIKRNKRDINKLLNKLHIIWDEDGQSMEQTYVYTSEDPGLWTIEKWQRGEREMVSRGIDVWYPDRPPKHPDVIKILKATPEMLIINHCSEVGAGGVFSLIFRRSFYPIARQEWYTMKNQFYDYDLPSLYRFSAVCGTCYNMASFSIIVISMLITYYFEHF